MAARNGPNAVEGQLKRAFQNQRGPFFPLSRESKPCVAAWSKIRDGRG
ncbi:hypothetical protein AVEN_259990-1, partial [Araneus ventricosus]